MVRSHEQKTALIQQAISELNVDRYGHDHFAQGAFLFALDLRDNADTLGASDAQFQSAIKQALDSNEGAKEHIKRNKLPAGFAEKAAQGRIELPKLDNPEVNHEWLLFPGKTLIHELVEANHEFFCSEENLFGDLKGTHNNENKIQLITTTMLTAISPPALMPYIPFCVACSYYIAYQELDSICSQTAPINNSY